MMSAGCTLAAGGQEYARVDPLALTKIIDEPYVIFLRRETALLSHGSWAGSMFMYDPPKFGFNRSQQRVLIAALHGGTDEELAEEVGISVSAVKKAWQSIYAQGGSSGRSALEQARLG